MNRRIYIGDKYLEFTDNFSQKTRPDNLLVYSANKEPTITPEEIARQLTSEKEKRNILLIDFELNAVFSELKKQFHYIEAAGGLIEQKGKWLFIRRHNRWDLPKGKLNNKEAIRHAAIRECEEECGIQELRIVRELSPTFHVYPHKGDFALKQTFWFHMTTAFSGDLTPQIEEDITEVRWFTAKEAHEIVLNDTYYTIADVVNEGIQKIN